MTEYAAPARDMRFVLNELAGLPAISRLPGLEEATADTVAAVLTEAAKFATEALAPLNRAGDLAGAVCKDNRVIPPAGFKEAYQGFVNGGWPALPFSPEIGGQGLPELVSAAANEIWQSANMAFALCPMLTEGCVVALEAHGSEALKAAYLKKLATGEWAGTMNLTEPQAGSDLAAIKTKAVPNGDRYLLSGRKIFITWGDQDFTDNIAHLILARLPEAPPGIKGISLFLVPKFIVNADGSLGPRNDVHPVSVEHKLGIHGSPTCVMSYGDNGGAAGHLVGGKHEGVACMFTIMNHARVGVGLQGLSVSERAWQQALAYAREREQGRTAGKAGRAKIIEHADVRRMLMLMKSGCEAMRAFAYGVAGSVDYMRHAPDAGVRQAHAERFALLTPVVKGWCSELAQEITYLGMQVHGGMGYIEETGAAQHYRDARITTIYEGTTGIQAQDLAGRKIIRDNGKAMGALLGEIEQTLAALSATEANQKIIKRELAAAAARLKDATAWLLRNSQEDAAAPGAAAVNFLMLTGFVCGGWQMARAALCAAPRAADDFYANKLLTARFYAEHYLPRSVACHAAIVAGSEAIMSAKL